MCLDSTRSATTQTKRTEGAADATRKLARIPLTKAKRASIIRISILPAALYGSEVAEASKKSMGKLRAAIEDTIGPRGTKRSTALTFEVCSGMGKDLDPTVQKLVRNVALIKRMMAKHEDVKSKVEEAIRRYTKRRMRGTVLDNTKREVMAGPLGPVGMLIKELAEHEAKVDVQ